MLITTKYLHVYSCQGMNWFRLFGIGLSIIDTKKHPYIPFSIRYSLRKHINYVRQVSNNILKTPAKITNR